MSEAQQHKMEMQLWIPPAATDGPEVQMNPKISIAHEVLVNNSLEAESF